jgi:hypothetical protein
MIAKLGDQKRIALNLVNDSMFIVDSPRPVAGEGML